ncbi:MAG: 1,4-dihydroxy-6-naphthoate synthase [Desulfobulbaceae bacterium A2]|nr:MAG: 1,4-dihydroxy-6-naphthoate synthase [Desulfobulbaceae bacterium A2]
MQTTDPSQKNTVAMNELSLGFSSCPNDTFIFHALAQGLVASPVFRLGRVVVEDVEELNRRALAQQLDISKLSFHAWGHVREQYSLLRAGAALGRGCGPLLVAADASAGLRLAEARIAIPGEYTTAALLLRLFEPRCRQLIPMRFDRIMPAILRGEVEAGAIIHEGRFTYAALGLCLVADLGQWWEGESGLPLPLGCIVARRSLGPQLIAAAEEAIRASLAYARQHPEASRDYVRGHAQELDDQVIDGHLKLYVNDFSEDLGPEGQAAVEELLRRGRLAGVFR